MYKVLLPFALVVAALAFGCNESTTPANPGQPGATPTVTVIIGMNAVGKGPAAFGANPLNIEVGTTVIWINQDIMAHTTTSDTAVWDSGLLQPGQSFSFQFNSGGDFPYHCQIHGMASMSGLVHVSGPAPSPTPSASPTPLAPTFTNVLNNVLVPHCVSCHEGPSPSAGLDFTTWQNLVHNPVLPNLIVPGNASQSVLFQHIQGGAPVGSQEHLTQEQITLVQDWIQSGAPNN